ncbi:MAG: radical SAM protein [Candidatus Peribacteria bacterium]|nr:radical SAM protein [Candidatus Peribacteria bacterium]
MKIFNKNQHAILDLIDGRKSVQDLIEQSKCTPEEMAMVFRLFEEKNMINFTGHFPVPKWNYNTKILHLWVHTTNDCCLRCTYCYIHTLGLKNFISKDTIQTLCTKIIQTVQIRELRLVSLRLAGGEPLIKFSLWKDSLIELKQQLFECNCKLHVSFLSNLVLLNDEVIQFIQENSFGIGVSLDGIGEFQDKTRHFKNGKGSFEIVERNIHYLIQKGLSPGIMTVISNANLEGMEQLTQFVIENSLSHRFSFVQGEDIDVQKLILTLCRCYDLFSKAIDEGYPFAKLHKLCDLKFLEPFFQTCSNGFNGGAIYPDGKIYFCQKCFGSDDANGSIFENDDLISIMQRKTYYRDVHSDCIECPLRYICTSGCPMERENGKDPHCEVYKEIVPIVFKLRGQERLRKSKNMFNN